MSREKWEWWVSSTKMTVWVATTTDESQCCILESAPIVRRFVGQPLVVMVRWMRRRGWGPVGHIRLMPGGEGE